MLLLRTALLRGPCLVRLLPIRYPFVEKRATVAPRFSGPTYLAAYFVIGQPRGLGTNANQARRWSLKILFYHHFAPFVVRPLPNPPVGGIPAGLRDVRATCCSGLSGEQRPVVQ